MKNQTNALTLKSRCRANILKAAMKIIKDKGWASLSIRQLLRSIGYTAPTFYSYFAAKNDLVSALIEMGFSQLIKRLKTARIKYKKQNQQITAMWIAYMDFGNSESELYQVMFGVGIKGQVSANGTAKLCREFTELADSDQPNPGEPEKSYSDFLLQWAAAHGIISLRLTTKKIPDLLETAILIDTIKIFRKDVFD